MSGLDTEDRNTLTQNTGKQGTGTSKPVTPVTSFSDTEKELRTKLEQVDKNRDSIKEQLDIERLKRVTSEVINTVTSPQFVEKMRQARKESDNGANLSAAARLLSLDSLRESGADIPADFRLTSRVFEDKVEGLRIEVKEPSGSSSNSAERAQAVAGGCAGAGGWTFCGCGGTS